MKRYKDSHTIKCGIRNPKTRRVCGTHLVGEGISESSQKDARDLAVAAAHQLLDEHIEVERPE
jgi:hypothetical protein